PLGRPTLSRGRPSRAADPFSFDPPDTNRGAPAPRPSAAGRRRDLGSPLEFRRPARDAPVLVRILPRRNRTSGRRRQFGGRREQATQARGDIMDRDRDHARTDTKTKTEVDRRTEEDAGEMVGQGVGGVGGAVAGGA